MNLDMLYGLREVVLTLTEVTQFARFEPSYYLYICFSSKKWMFWILDFYSNVWHIYPQELFDSPIMNIHLLSLDQHCYVGMFDNRKCNRSFTTSRRLKCIPYHFDFETMLLKHKSIWIEAFSSPNNFLI